jgi:hypothetical protein
VRRACERCGRLYEKPTKYSAAQWAKARFCTRECQRPSLEDRLAEGVEPEPTSGCWIWCRQRMNKGYGIVTIPYQGQRLAHRASYEFFRGPIPNDKELDHLCRVRACINPNHLEVVDRRTNQLRGFGPGGINARKTHCPRGHAYDATKKLRDGRIGRECLTCRRASLRERYRAKQRA